MIGSKAGGAAAQRGMNFQNKLSAWIAVNILAECDASDPWDLRSKAKLDYIYCETDYPVDDILIVTTEKSFIHIQAKTTLSLSPNPRSSLASVVDQFIRQFIFYRKKQNTKNISGRSLECSRDRIILAVSTKAPASIRIDLHDVINRIRTIHPDTPLSKVGVNEREKKAFSIFIQHLKKIWISHLSLPPSDRDLIEILTLIRIVVFDFENNTTEKEAKNLLRFKILGDPGQVNNAWNFLINLCAEFTTNRSGGGRLDFQRKLLQEGIELKAAESYEADINKLIHYSKETKLVMKNISRIKTSKIEIKIKRNFTSKIRKIIKDTSLLVVGEPGAGKSGVLYDVVDSLAAENIDFIYIVVDRLLATSLLDLKDKMNLEHDIHNVFENWPGIHPGILIIDALDAARSEPEERTIRELIKLILNLNNRWKVVASIRKFDLRYSEELKTLFKGTPASEYCDNEFASISHINIPKLSVNEINQITPQSKLLGDFISQASINFNEILSNLFNLWLLAELLSIDIDPTELSPIRTQLALLDKYWRMRILRPRQQSDVRESFLLKTCEAMVTRRQLHIERSIVIDTTINNTLDDILSMNVLCEWQRTPQDIPDRYILTFSHHILFDYAVARLLIRGELKQLRKMLIENSDLLIYIRPSLVLHFQHLWINHRDEFWTITYCLSQMDNFPEIGKILGPTIFVNNFQQMKNVDPLFIDIEGQNKITQNTAEKIFNLIIKTIIAIKKQHCIVGQGAPPWSGIAERLSRSITPFIIIPLINLLKILCENPIMLTTKQLKEAGTAARRLLTCSWKLSDRDSYLIYGSIQCVCRTFESDLNASINALLPALKYQHIKQYGYDELPCLVRELKRLITIAPDFIAKVYTAVFSYEEKSEETVALGFSSLVPLTTTKKQDYHLAKYHLAQLFPDFITSWPQKGIKILLQIMDKYVKQEHIKDNETPCIIFTFKEMEARYQEDYSYIWDERNIYNHHNELKMLESFNIYLEKLSEQANNINKFKILLNILIKDNKYAIIWRRFLQVGTKFPKFGKIIVPLAYATPILMGMSTSVEMGEYLKKIFPILPDKNRELIEITLLDLPKNLTANQHDTVIQIRNRLIGCLSEDSIKSDEVRSIFMKLKTNNAIPSNKNPFSVGWSNEPYTEAAYLKDEGVPVDDEPNQKILKLEYPVKEFTRKYINSIPELEEINEIFPDLRKLYDALLKADKQGVHHKLRDYSWGFLADACSRIASIKNIDREKKYYFFIQKILINAANNPEPRYNPVIDSQFNENQSWGYPAARIYAAQGLIKLASNSSTTFLTILPVIEKLTEDPVSSVRYQIARRLNILYKINQSFVWKQIKWFSEKETNRGVLQGLLIGTMHTIAGSNPERIKSYTLAIYERIKAGPGVKSVRESCIKLLTALYIWRNTPGTGEIIYTIIKNPVNHSIECLNILISLRNVLTYGPVDPPDPEKDMIRKRSIDLFSKILKYSYNELIKLETSYTKKDLLVKSIQKKIRQIAEIIDTAGSEIYFASGSHYHKQTQGKHGKDTLSMAHRKRFYEETNSIFDILTKVGIPGVIHTLLKIIWDFIPFDPEGIIIKIGRIIEIGQKGNYQYETMAVDMIVQIVERYLAGYRLLFKKNEQCRQELIKILDIFVTAGWPSAYQLTYRLEEIFR